MTNDLKLIAPTEPTGERGGERPGGPGGSGGGRGGGSGTVRACMNGWTDAQRIGTVLCRRRRSIIQEAIAIRS